MNLKIKIIIFIIATIINYLIFITELYLVSNLALFLGIFFNIVSLYYFVGILLYGRKR